jgi:hypothetical protein
MIPQLKEKLSTHERHSLSHLLKRHREKGNGSKKESQKQDKEIFFYYYSRNPTV